MTTDTIIKQRAKIAYCSILNLMNELRENGYTDETEGMNVLSEALGFTQNWG
jgi:hypothetical protein